MASWGCDSLTPVSTAFAEAVQFDYSSVGAGCGFWGRYFINAFSPADVWSNSESSALYTANIPKVLPIDVTGNLAPCGGSTTCNTMNQGAADGHAMVQKAVDIQSSDGLGYASGTTRLFLDVEEYEGISAGYWGGWSFGVNFQQVDSDQNFQAAAYCGSYGTDSQGNDNGNTIDSAGGCASFWANEPEYDDLPGQPAWGPPYGPPGIGIDFWQFRTNVTVVSPIDCDMANPNFGGPGETDSVLDYLMNVPGL